MTRAFERNVTATEPGYEKVCMGRSLSLAAQALCSLLDYARETDEPLPAVVDAADHMHAAIELLRGALE